MGYTDLNQCVADLKKINQLKVIDFPFDPNLEISLIQRLALKAGSPALFFINPKGCNYPILANLYGSKERVEFIFRDTLKNIKLLFELFADPSIFFAKTFSYVKLLPKSRFLLQKRCKNPPVLENQCSLEDLPQLVSWPHDGGPFATLPLVYTEHPEFPGRCNLGMYRIQISGNNYNKDEAGLHYQIHRGIGAHHAHALSVNKNLPVHVYIGGAPALTIAAIMPLPEGMSELLFANLLAGARLPVSKNENFALPILGNCDFLIEGEIGKDLKPEGPFGDHMGYYSLKHNFPVLKVKNVYHKNNAIWPFTSVGRPPQEDTNFGDLIHELTAPMVKRVFPGISQINAVDAAGVHPLLLAVGSERYTPYEIERKPRELLTLALHLLGRTQTSLAKYLLLACKSDNAELSVRDIPGFFTHILERTNFQRDLHFLPNYTCDTLDYSGGSLHEGSKLIWVCAGKKIRELGIELTGNLQLPAGFHSPKLVDKGILAISGPAHQIDKGKQDPAISENLCAYLEKWNHREHLPLVIIVDDSRFCAESFNNFLWVTFTRSDPDFDTYGIKSKQNSKSWCCEPPFIIDARIKIWHAPTLEDQPEVLQKVLSLATRGAPLAGII